MSQTILPNGGGRRWWVLVVISAALFMVFLDATIVNIALPHIMVAFNEDIASVEWVLNAYILVFAALLITLGKLGDIFGRKKLFLSGLGLFTAASLLCGISPNNAFLVGARGLQAIGGAAMMPATLSILNVTFSERDRGLALGIWGAIAGAANALGPVIGGVLVDTYSWRLIFLVNLPVGIIALIAGVIIVGESRDSHATRYLDYPGVITSSLALFCLTYALVEGQHYGWSSPAIIGLFAASLIGLIAFILVERRSPGPLMPLGLFRDATFSAGNAVGLLVMFGLLGILFLLSLFLQLVLGFSATKAGLTIIPMPIVMIFVAPVAGKLSDRIGGRWLLFLGMLIAAVGIFLMSNLSTDTTQQSLILPLVVCGVGMGLVMAPTTAVVMENAPVDKSGSAAGILATMRQIGTVLGISIMGALLQNQLVSNITKELDKFPQIPSAIRDKILEELASGSLVAGSANVSSLPAAIRDAVVRLFHEQFAVSLNSTMKVSIFVLVFGALIALFVRARGLNNKGKAIRKPGVTK
jgi:EmrB/QacA subfamily drug resistance transporter